MKQCGIHIVPVRWRRGWLCFAAAHFALASGHPAFTQALPTGTGPGAYATAGGTFSEFQADYGRRTISGASIYVDSNLDWRYGIETEARRMAYPDFGERQSTLLAGPRWSFRPKGFVPYVKLLAGGGRFDFPYGYGTGNYFAVAPGAGIDLSLGEGFVCGLPTSNTRFGPASPSDRSIPAGSVRASATRY